MVWLEFLFYNSLLKLLGGSSPLLNQLFVLVKFAYQLINQESLI